MQAILTFLNTFLKYLLMNQKKSDAFYKHQDIEYIVIWLWILNPHFNISGVLQRRSF